MKNAKFSATLASIIAEASSVSGVSSAEEFSCDKKVGQLLYTVASKLPPNALVHRPLVISGIMKGDLVTKLQLDGCFSYLKTVGAEPIDPDAYKTSCGIGIVVTDADIDAAFETLLESYGEKLTSERYRCVGPLLPKLRDVGDMKWADQKTLKMTFDRKILEFLGPKTEADMQKGGKKKKKKDKDGGEGRKSKGGAAGGAPAADVASPPSDPYAIFTKPEENNMVHTTVTFSDGRGVMRIANSKGRLDAYLSETKGKFMTRFPPEPNGYLHIGHAKAMFVDFGLAAKHEGGVCYLRYDDTNPTAEKTEYIDHIQEIVGWMGWKPWKITYSSDYFDQLHALAVKLIEGGHAYVCHQTGEEISEYRQLKKNSPWRDRPVEENLRLFEDMRLGLVDEGKATLRMKGDMQNENFNMYDLIAYRIKFAKHPHAGDKWCIYPSYDFTHCIVDSLENISHSLCTLEFEPRRASYYWLLEVLDLYKPLVWEYSRLNITHNVLSKRKLNKLVTDEHVNGWDDPRLLTLAGLRRRGATPEAINNFCRDLGITRNENDIPYHKLDYHMRVQLDEIAERRFGVLRPLRVEIENVKPEEVLEVKGKRFPGRSEDTFDLCIGDAVYIEESDFREEDHKTYYGMAPGKTVMLRYGFAVKCTGYVKDEETGKVVLIKCERVEVSKPPKGIIHWVADSGSIPADFAPVKAEVRLYGNLFNSENVAEVENWLSDVNPESLQVLEGCLMSPELRKAKVGDKFQLERVGYFCVDPDTTPELLVLNRTCSLRESVFTKGAKTAAKKGK